MVARTRLQIRESLDMCSTKRDVEGCLEAIRICKAVLDLRICYLIRRPGNHSTDRRDGTDGHIGDDGAIGIRVGNECWI